MKNEQINLRTSPEDKALIEKAAKKLQEETGSKPMTSRVILHSVAEYANQEPELFFVNRPAIRDVDANLSKGKKMLQAIYDLANKAGISVSLEEIESWYGKGRQWLMVSNPEAIREKVISNLFEAQRDKYPGLQFSRENVLVPDLTELLEAASQLINIPEVANREIGVYWSCYQISEGIISVIPEQVEQVKDSFRGYAITVQERFRLARVKVLCKALDAFIAEKDVPPEKLNIASVCYFDSESNKYEPSEQFVKFTLKSTLIFNH